MLHITNGDSTAGTLRLTGLPGEVLAWREDLISGPVPQGLSLDEWLSVRAGFLSEAYGGDMPSQITTRSSYGSSTASFARPCSSTC